MELTKITGINIDIVDNQVKGICIIESKTSYNNNSVVLVREGLARVSTLEELSNLIEISWLTERAQLIANSRPTAINGLTVTTSTGRIFDANDASRLNMLSAIQASLDSPLTETDWLMADGTVQKITLAELKEAQFLAIELVGSIKTGKSLPGAN